MRLCLPPDCLSLAEQQTEPVSRVLGPTSSRGPGEAAPPQQATLPSLTKGKHSHPGAAVTFTGNGSAQGQPHCEPSMCDSQFY